MRRVQKFASSAMRKEERGETSTGILQYLVQEGPKIELLSHRKYAALLLQREIC
jgi:hypothetical protein